MDVNQSTIVQALRKIGASVLHLHPLGRGAPDILVGWRGINVLLELKDGSLAPSRRVLTPDERSFYESWRGQLAIAESVEDALQIVREEGRERIVDVS